MEHVPLKTYLFVILQCTEEFRYMKIHIFALRWRDEIRRSSQLRTLLKLVVVNRTWKKFRPIRDLNPIWFVLLQIFRTDLISAMKLADHQNLSPENYVTISDQWRQEWERGVQVIKLFKIFAIFMLSMFYLYNLVEWTFVFFYWCVKDCLPFL